MLEYFKQQRLNDTVTHIYLYSTMLSLVCLYCQVDCSFNSFLILFVSFTDIITMC